MSTKQSPPTNPFQSFLDMASFDPGKMLKDFRVPGVDMDSLLAAQRKNIEALTAANKAAVEGMQAVAKRQSEILTQVMAEAQQAMQQLAAAKDAQDLTNKQAELFKQAFEKALANMKELAELVNKANMDAFAVINQRLNESLEELKGYVAKK
ncbi:MAG TPA: TIGR01841 family phasin [Candidatus Competibacteraceae bacterium]|nr:TIGR01841 family phasin [Candidatus Competibacteraceae bacterium]